MENTGVSVGAQESAAFRRRLQPHVSCELVQAGQHLVTGVPKVDGAFRGGGLPLLACHEFSAASPGDRSATAGVGLGLVARLLDQKADESALFVQEVSAAHEDGLLYGPGLHAWGVDPDRVVLVSTTDTTDTLRVVDDALRSGAVSVVLAELWRAEGKLDLSATRRFNLAAARSGATAFLLTRKPAATSAAVTRWTVGSASSRAPAHGLLGRPAFQLSLTRNRYGRTGSWTVEWDSDERVFRPQAAVDLAGKVPHRPDRTPLPHGEAEGGRRQTG